MAEKAVGTIVLIVDGAEYDVISLDAQEMTGKKLIPTMNRQRRNKFVADGNRSFSLSFAVVIPEGKDLVDWTAIDGARIAVESPEGDHRVTYIDCFITEASSAYSVEGDTRRSLSGFALDKIDESV